MKRGESLLVSAEVALAVVTLSVVVGMNRLFADGGWLGPLLVNVIASHLIVAVCRRRGLSLTLAGAVVGVGALLVGTWACYWYTTAAGLPTGDTWAVISADLGDAWTLFQDVPAPAPTLPGFVFASAVAIWAVAYVADWAAFRLWVPFEATLPAGTLFLFTAILAPPAGRTWSVALYGSALIGFLLLHRLTRQDSVSHWVGDRRQPGHRSLLIAGASLGLVAVSAGTIFGPALPGADAPGVIDPRVLSQDSKLRETVSPLVDIRKRLIDQSNVELFRVTSTEPAYWRLTSLERFDGRIWRSSGSYDGAEDDLPATLPDDLAAESVQQTITIDALSSLWLPAAYEPRAIDTDDVAVLYDDDSGTLIVDRQLDTSDGLTYAVTSSSPRITEERVAESPAGETDDVSDDYLELPDEVSPEVRELARDVTADATTPFETARALQDYLRTFTYDLTVTGGHSASDLDQFLFTTKRGYCQQFAGAYAVMARAIGLPARVAVGFTQGTANPQDPNEYIVRGEHAHAWPEVYLSGTGWVPFEPTPNRGMPFAQDYTGVEPAQAAAGDPGGVDASPPTSSTDTLPTTPTSGNPRDPFEDLDTGASDPSDPIDDGGTSTPLKILLPIGVLVLVLLGLGLVHLICFPLALLWVRHRRRVAARDQPPADRIRLAWREAADAARTVGYSEVASDTYAERAARLSGRLDTAGVGDAAANLAHRQEIAIFSADGADELDAELAAEDSLVIRAAVRAEAERRARVLAWIDPRPHVRRWRWSRATAHRHITTRVRPETEAELEREPELTSTSR